MSRDERLDRLIGTEIIGLRVRKKRFSYGKPPIGYRLENKKREHVGYSTGFFGWGWQSTKEAAWSECPKFSTDIAAAWHLWTLMASDQKIFARFLEEACKLACRTRRLWSYPVGLQKMTPRIICVAALHVSKAWKRRFTIAV